MDEIPAAPAEFPVTLDEFCTHLSARDKRVELIAVFAHVERNAKRVSDMPSAYAARFAAVGNIPTQQSAPVIVRRRR